MAAVNSLLLILSTLSPYRHSPENSPVTHPSIELLKGNGLKSHSFPKHGAHSEIFSDQKCPSPFEWYTCSAHCPRTCDNPNMRPCEGCVPGCDCVPPLVRGPRGDCIFRYQCPNSGLADWKLKKLEREEECGPEEEISCFSHCEKNCTNYYQKVNCPIYCVKGCVCKEPKIRGPDGSCILPEYCPSSQHLRLVNQYNEIQKYKSRSMVDNLEPFPSCRGENEIWSICPSGCPDDCENYENERRGCKVRSCLTPRCECKPGFVRGPSGDCIKPEQCPKYEPLKIIYPGGIVWSLADNCTENEVYKRCGSNCQKNCDDYDKTVSCISTCVIGCFCKEPLVRGPNGDCIHIEECPPRKPLARKDVTCPENEYYKDCEAQCNYPGAPYPCSCVPGCYCNDSMIRDSDGKCRHKEKLLQQRRFSMCRSDDEEFLICGSACDVTCANYDKNISCVPMCSQGCFCKEPKVRGPDGDCIFIEECPPRPSEPPLYSGIHRELAAKCSENEEYKACGTLYPKDCDNYDKNIAPSWTCVLGCFCKDPLIRGPDGRCIRIEECPKKPLASKGSDASCQDGKCREPLADTRKPFPLRQNWYSCPSDDEEFLICGSACDVTCSNYDKNISCVQMCSPGCFCKEPKVRGPDGKCVSIEDCPPRSSDSHLHSGTFPHSANGCPENEEYKECGTACQKNCSNYDDNIPCWSSVCVSGCFCKDPMIRGPDGGCIRKDQCPRHPWARKGFKAPPRREFLPPFPTLKCRENEEFSICASICPDNCNNYQTDRLCKHICLPGCKCKDGYVFGNEGTCIKKEECRIPKPDECTDLEYYDECGTHCETDCYNFQNPNRTCEIKDCKKGCFCKPGWLRSADWKCVLPETCQK